MKLSEKSVPSISTGEPSTLATYRRISAVLTGDDSPATKWIDAKIKTQGEHAEVVQSECQMMYLIVQFGLGLAKEVD